MSHLDLPLWAAVPVALLLVIGSGFALIGAIGLVRLRSFFMRFHAPALGTSFGTLCILIASIVVFSVSQGRTAFHEVLIYLFLILTAPVTAMTLIRAAVYRKRDAKPGEPTTELPPGHEEET